MNFQDFSSPNTTTTCPHCKSTTETGTHGGCSNCGKVKYTRDGRKVVPTEE